MTDMTIKTSSQAVNRAIKAVKATGDKYNQSVQTAIVLVVRHANDYGDCTGAARLLDAMPRSNRRQLVVDHFAQYSPINVTKDSKTGGFKATLRKPFYDKAETKPDENYRPFNIDGVKANNWWERPEAAKLPDVVSYDSLHKSIMSMLDSKLKKADDCENDNDKQLAKDFIRSIRSAASAFSVKLLTENNLKGTEWDDEAPATNDVIKAA